MDMTKNVRLKNVNMHDCSKSSFLFFSPLIKQHALFQGPSMLLKWMFVLNLRTHYFHTGGFTLANIQTKHRYNKSVICESPRSRARCGEVRGKRRRLTVRVWVGGWESELTEQSMGVLRGRFSLSFKGICVCCPR